MLPYDEGDERSSTEAGAFASNSLEAAEAFLRRSLCSDGTNVRCSAEEQWQMLREWATRESLILPRDFTPAEISRTAEHDVRFDGAIGRWFKYTIPGFCGLTVDWDGEHDCSLRMATPWEYIRRFKLQNTIFMDTIRLCGLWYDEIGGGWRIVISQPDISGEPPSRLQILEGMRGYGFTPLGIPGPNNAPAFQRDNLVVWDGHPGNLVWTKDEVLVPIDLIITELS